MVEIDRFKGMKPLDKHMLDLLYGKDYICLPSDKPVRIMCLKKFGLKDTPEDNKKLRDMMFENSPEFAKVIKELNGK